MQVKDLRVDLSQLGTGSYDSGQPLGFLDLDALPAMHAQGAVTLPPFPLIGIGDAAHPVASTLDAIVEPPVSADALIRQTLDAPHAAAVAIQLLRNLEGLPVERALPLESMSYGLLQGSGEHAAWLARQPPSAEVGARTQLPPAQLIVERRGSVLHLLIDRPEARNAIDRVLRDRLFEAFTVAALDSDVSAIELRATGPAFSIGGDLREFGTTRDPATAHLIRRRTLPAIPLSKCAAILDVHIQGACVGAGLELAAFARRVTATSDAWFQLPELSMGLIPGAGGCVSIPRRIGRQRAALMILSGRRINAAAALRWHLIDAIF